MNGALASLRELIEHDKAVEDLPELFPFALLKEFDVRDIAALVSPRAVTLRVSGQ